MTWRRCGWTQHASLWKRDDGRARIADARFEGSVRLSIVAVGIIKQAGLRAELDDYLARIRRYASCDEIELKDGREEQVVDRFAKAIPGRAQCVALEVGGQSWSSQRLSSYIYRCEQESVAHVCWLIGGAYGLPRQVSDRAELQLSLSAMTFPHRLVRLMLAEQLYRAFTMLRNEPYAH
jgi:23S rRNA (pseudouridine1915-N3)-methyltransferase